MNMQEQENYFEKLLNIKTTGTDSSYSNVEDFPYEATPYAILNKLYLHDLINKNNHLVDFGSGKGRVPIFFSFFTKCKSTGIEVNERLYLKSLENRKNAKCIKHVDFILDRAENFKITPSMDRFFFFNPFGIIIFKQVFSSILNSQKEAPRDILLFFYFPDITYKEYLNKFKEVSLTKEIDCSEFFNDEKEREKILVYRIVKG